MTALATIHELTWKMRLCDAGYTAHELVDVDGRRWGWVINAALFGSWTAHVGSFGQAVPPTPVDDLLEHPILTARDLDSAKAWVEQQIADAWKILSDGPPSSGAAARLEP